MQIIDCNILRHQKLPSSFPYIVRLVHVLTITTGLLVRAKSGFLAAECSTMFCDHEICFPLKYIKLKFVITTPK